MMQFGPTMQQVALSGRPFRMNGPMLGEVRITHRPFMRYHAFLGSPDNRLLEMPIEMILARRLIAVTGGLDESLRALFRNLGVSDPDAVAARLLEVIRDPSSEEIEDAGRIDRFFRPLKVFEGDELLNDICIMKGGRYVPAEQPLPRGQRRRVPGRSEEPQTIQFGRFLCPITSDSDLFGDYSKAYFGMMGGIGEAIERHGSRIPWPYWRKVPPQMWFWDVPPSARWGDVRPRMPNMEIVDEVLRKYPFPAGPYAGKFAIFWLRIVLPSLRKFSETPGLTEDLVRLWITLSIVANGKQIEGELMDYIDDEEHKAKARARLELIANIILAVGFAIFAIILPVGLIATGFSGLKTFLEQKEKREAAKEVARDLEEAAAEIKSQDAAFSGELQNASDVIRFFAEESERAAGEIERGIPGEEGEEGIPTGEETLETEIPLLAVGAGVVGAGLLVYLLAT